MSMPSDVNPDVAEAVRTIEDKVPPKVRDASRSLLRKVTPEQYGFAAAAFIAFLGVAICGPRVQEMRKPRRQRMIDRARRAARQATKDAQGQAREARDRAGRRLRQLGGGAVRR